MAESKETVVIRLQQNHIEYAEKIGRMRRANALSRSRKPCNGATEDKDGALALDINGALCECAGYLYLRPVQWHRFRPYGIKDLPDYDDWIDAKGRTKSWHNLIVQRNDPDHWAYLLVCGHDHPDYHIIGWMMGKEAKQTPITDPARGRPAHFIEHKHLLPPRLLYEEVRARERAKTIPG